MRFLTQNFTQENQILLGNFISHSDLERKEFHFVRRRTICPQTFAACFHPFQDGRKCGHTLRNYPSNQNLGQQLKSQNSDFHKIMICEHGVWTWTKWMKVCPPQNCCHLFVRFSLFEGRLLNLLRIALHLSRELERCSVPFPTICTPTTTYHPLQLSNQPTYFFMFVGQADWQPPQPLLPSESEQSHIISPSIFWSLSPETCWELGMSSCWISF